MSSSHDRPSPPPRSRAHAPDRQGSDPDRGLQSGDMAQLDTGAEVEHFQRTPAPMPVSPQGQMLPPVGEAIVEEDEEEDDDDDDDYGAAAPVVSEADLEPSLPRAPSVRFADQVETAMIGQSEPVESSSGGPPRPLSLSAIQTPSRDRQTASHLTPHPSADRTDSSPSHTSSQGASAAIRGRAAADAAASRLEAGDASAGKSRDTPGPHRRHFAVGAGASSAPRSPGGPAESSMVDLLRFPLKRDVWRAPNARRAARSLGGPSFGTRRSQATAQEYSERRTTELARVFALLDEDADGLLDVDQMRIFVAAAGFAPTPVFLQKVIDSTPRRWAHKGIDFDTVVAALETRAEDEPLSEDDLAHLLKVACGPTWTDSSARQAMQAEGEAERQAVQLLASEREREEGAAGPRGGSARGGAARSGASEAVRSKIRNGGLSRCVARSDHAMRLLCEIETQVQSRLTAAEADTLLRSAGAFAVSAEGSQEPAMDVLDFVSWLSSGYTRQVRSHHPDVPYQMSPTAEAERKKRMEQEAQPGSAGSQISFTIRGTGRSADASDARGGAGGGKKKGAQKPASALARLTASSFDPDRVAASDPEEFLRKARELEARADKLGM